MGCVHSKHVELPPTLPVVEGSVTHVPPPPPQHVGESSSAPVSRTRKTSSPREPDPTHHQESRHRKRAISTPQRLQAMRDSERMPSFGRQRTKSVTAPSTHSRPPVPELPKAKAGKRIRRPSRKSLLPMVRRVLPDHPRFRILVAGKRGSGKSSLVNTVFKVDMSVALQHASGKSDINFAFRPEDNRYLVVHEFSGFEPGDAQGLHSIRNFIAYRTDPSRSVWQRLHAVWICIPVSDLLSGNIGEGVEEILAMSGVPIIVAITKFDVVVSQVLLESEDENSQHHERMRTRAYTECEQSYYSLFRNGLENVPLVILSVKSQFRDLVDNLIATTDRLIMDPSAASTPSSRSGVRGAKGRIAPVPLAWSVALRVSRDIIIQTSIEVGRSRYWRSLWSSMDFVDQPLKNCVKAIHADIVEIWNMDDKTKCLMSPEFMVTMSHIVKDLAGPAGGMRSSLIQSGSGDKFAEWAQDVYRGSPENVQCIMGYIVDLTKILDDIFRTANGTVSVNDLQSAMSRHVRSGQDKIHWDIRGCVTHAFATRFTAPGKDMILEKIIDLIEK